MKKYVLINTGTIDSVEEALVKRSIYGIAVFSTLKEAKAVKKSTELVSLLNFTPSDKDPVFKSFYKIITIKEV